MSAQFEADLCPETGAPRIRFNFPNGWSASIVLRMPAANGCDFSMASMAICPTGQWGEGKTIVLGNEMSAEEVAHWLAGTDLRGTAASDRARDYADEVIEGGSGNRLRVHLAGQLGIADELLIQALRTLRETLAATIEGDSYLTSDGDPVPAKIPENRDVIEQLFEEIALIREIEEHVCKPYTGPAWLDEIIEQGPAWAGEPA